MRDGAPVGWCGVFGLFWGPVCVRAGDVPMAKFAHALFVIAVIVLLLYIDSLISRGRTASVHPTLMERCCIRQDLERRLFSWRGGEEEEMHSSGP